MLKRCIVGWGVRWIVCGEAEWMGVGGLTKVHGLGEDGVGTAGGNESETLRKER